MGTGPRFAIRPARHDDAPAFLDLVAELARFEKLEPPDQAARKRLVDDAFGPDPRIRVLLVSPEDSTEPFGYAILVTTYSSFLARPTLYLEDIYLQESHRGTGAAQALLREIAATALELGCGRVEGIVLDWNERARAFYRRTGAQELGDWVFLRYDEEALTALAGKER